MLFFFLSHTHRRPTLRDAAGVRPLHKASLCSNEAVVRKLVEYGADVDVPDSEGNTALHLAARSGFSGVVAVLLECNANAGLKNKLKQTALDVTPATESATRSLLQ